MTKQERERLARQQATLQVLGFTADEAAQLRRISRILQRWYELACGDSNEYSSWDIERDDDGKGPPFWVHYRYRGKGADNVTRTRIPDRERGAKKRLAAILSQRNGRLGIVAGRLTAAPGGKFCAYIQTDPRGTALYLLRPGDVPEGESVESYYTRGICVY